MSAQAGAASHATRGIEPSDPSSGFRCGKHALDDYFARHALPNHRAGIARAYVMPRLDHDDVALPAILGFYTLSMAIVASADVNALVVGKLPRYPMPVALMGRLAVDARAQGRRLGERLLIDALRRIVDASTLVACIGIIVDAKDEAAEAFYSKYDFASLSDEGWPRRMFLPLSTAKDALAD